MTHRRNRAGVLIGGGLLAGAVAKELRTPAAERSWHGRLGPVPYDLRRPTVARLRKAWWDPEQSKLLVPTALGVGWTVNFAAVTRAFGTHG